ncbi:MAG: hypothetical protein WA057_02740 [Candidatus Magasanikiibacteriota bacterium]
MKILFITSSNMIAPDMARLLQDEGNQVKLFIDDKNRSDNFENIIKKCKNWKQELAWVGKDGLIIFDDVGYGKIQDNLREHGFAVFGGNAESDKLEMKRSYAQDVLKDHGLQTLETWDFDNIDDCVNFIKKSKKTWVLKQNDHKLNINTVSQFKDNQDILDVLKLCKTKYKNKVKVITLQEKVEGVEIGVGRFFNGKNWVGPVEINFEHKRLFDGDVGPMTTEMGTLAWLETEKDSVLFKKTLSKLKPFLKKIKFRGDFEINFIINGQNIYPLEITPRLGSPIVHLQSEMLNLKWAQFLKALALGKSLRPKWKKGYGLVVLLAVPPFPYMTKLGKNSPRGVIVYLDKVTKNDFKHIFFEGVSKEKVQGKEHFYISDDEGYVLYVTGVGKAIAKVQKNVYGIIKKIYVPKSLYRRDIGSKFLFSDEKLLKKWGYIK